jgi:iron complex outermembrane recepter protein
VVPGYVALDARIGWRVTDGLELSLAGSNLLDDQHPETRALAARRDIPRTVYLGARLSF